MKAYRIGRIDGEWVNRVPPIQGGQYQPDEEEIASSGNNIAGENWSTHQEAPALPFETVNDFGIKQSPVQAGAYSKPEDCARAMVQQQIDFDLANYPSLDIATQKEISHKFQALHERVRREGFYVCRLRDYAADLCRYAILFTLFLLCLRKEWYLASASFLGLFWHQIMFTAHDAGHNGITGCFEWDTLIGILIGDFCCGLSVGWWKSSHHVHHFVTNDPVRIYQT